MYIKGYNHCVDINCHWIESPNFYSLDTRIEDAVSYHRSLNRGGYDACVAFIKAATDEIARYSILKFKYNATLIVLTMLYHYWRQIILSNSSKELDYEKVKMFHELREYVAQKFGDLRIENISKCFLPHDCSQILDFSHDELFKNVCCGFPEKPKLSTAKLGLTKTEKFWLAFISIILFPLGLCFAVFYARSTKETSRLSKAEAKFAMFYNKLNQTDLSADLQKRKSIIQFWRQREQQKSNNNAPAQNNNLVPPIVPAIPNPYAQSQEFLSFD